MRITRKSLIVVAVVLALAVMATPVIASSKIIRLERSTFMVTFNVGTCQVVTDEYSTKHFVFNRPVASTNVGTATATGVCPPINVGGVPVPIPNFPVPFAVVDIRNPGNDTVIKTYAMVAYVLGSAFPGLPVPPDAPVQAGVTAELINRGHQSLEYNGYVYIYTVYGDYLTVPFVAVGDPDSGFSITVPAP